MFVAITAKYGGHDMPSLEPVLDLSVLGYHRNFGGETLWTLGKTVCSLCRQKKGSLKGNNNMILIFRWLKKHTNECFIYFLPYSIK